MRLPLLRVASLKLTSRPEETEARFKKRVADLLRTKKEAASDKLTEQYAKKQHRLATRLEKAYARVDKEKGDVKARGIDTALSVGLTIFGALFGGKSLSVSNANRTVRSARGAGRVIKEQADVKRAEEAVRLIQEDIDALARELQEKLADLSDTFAPENYTVETFNITPRHQDIYNLQIRLLWEPVLDFSDVTLDPANPE